MYQTFLRKSYNFYNQYCVSENIMILYNYFKLLIETKLINTINTYINTIFFNQFPIHS